MHAALVQQNINMIGFLLLNGADMYAIDSKGVTPISMIEDGQNNSYIPVNDNPHIGTEINKMCLQLLGGDF